MKTLCEMKYLEPIRAEKGPPHITAEEFISHHSMLSDESQKVLTLKSLWLYCLKYYLVLNILKLKNIPDASAK